MKLNSAQDSGKGVDLNRILAQADKAKSTKHDVASFEVADGALCSAPLRNFGGQRYEKQERADWYEAAEGKRQRVSTTTSTFEC